jgi:hypothetical protein
MIEGLENPAGGDGLGVFGKQIRKKRKLSDVLGALSKLSDVDDEMYEDTDLSSFVSVKPERGGSPMYDPNQLYGRMYQMYGGRRVRGGLLGE